MGATRTTEGGHWLHRLVEPARAWVARTQGLVQWVRDKRGRTVRTDTPNQTNAYVDLLFAFGLARLDYRPASEELVRRAQGALEREDEAHCFLLDAYRSRIAEATEGRAHAGRLPAGLLNRLPRMELILAYIVDRLRKHSRVLEPDQRVDPYRHWRARVDGLESALAELTDLTDKDEIARRVDSLLKQLPEGPRGATRRAIALRAGLEAAPQAGEEFAKRMLADALHTYDALPEPKESGAPLEQAALLEKALFVAGHYRRADQVFPLVARFRRVLQAQRRRQALPALESLTGQCFGWLAWLEVGGEFDRLLQETADAALQGREVQDVGFFAAPDGVARLRVLLHVAAGWYARGRGGEAEPVLQAAHSLLQQGNLFPREQTALACAYAGALGKAPVAVARTRLEGLFERLEGVSDFYTTTTHFSASRLDVVEAVVLTAVEAITRDEADDPSVVVPPPAPDCP